MWIRAGFRAAVAACVVPTSADAQVLMQRDISLEHGADDRDDGIGRNAVPSHRSPSSIAPAG